MFGFLGKIFGGGILKSIFGGIGDFFKHKRELAAMRAKVEAEIELKKIDMIATQQTHDIKWDLIMAKASADSWKDELWTLIFAGIFIAVFIPPLQPYVDEGLKILSNMGSDIKMFIGTAIAAAFGRAELTKFINRKN